MTSRRKLYVRLSRKFDIVQMKRFLVVNVCMICVHGDYFDVLLFSGGHTGFVVFSWYLWKIELRLTSDHRNGSDSPHCRRRTSRFMVFARWLQYVVLRAHTSLPRPETTTRSVQPFLQCWRPWPTRIQFTERQKVFFLEIARIQRYVRAMRPSNVDD